MTAKRLHRMVRNARLNLGGVIASLTKTANVLDRVAHILEQRIEVEEHKAERERREAAGLGLCECGNEVPVDDMRGDFDGTELCPGCWESAAGDPECWVPLDVLREDGAGEEWIEEERARREAVLAAREVTS